MPRQPDKYKPGRDRDAARKAYEAREPIKVPPPDPISQANTTIGLLKQKYGARFDAGTNNILNKPVIRIPLTDKDKDMIVGFVKDLGYDFRKRNTVRVTEDAVLIDAAQFARHCEDKNWKGSLLIENEEVRQRLIAQDRADARRRLGPGGSAETSRS